MGDTTRNTLPVSFARDENIIQKCDYVSASAKGFFQDASLVLTNKRLIHVMFEKKKRLESHYLEEVPVEEIDSVDYSHVRVRNKVSLLAIIFSILLVAAAVVMFILSSQLKDSQQMVWIGIGLIAAAAIIVLLAILLRKWRSSFRLIVYSHEFKQDHLGVSNEKAVEAQVAKNEKKHKALKWVIIDLLVNAAGIGGMVALGFSMNNSSSSGPNMAILIPMIVIASIIVVFNFFSLVMIRRSRRVKKMRLAVDMGGGKNTVKVAVNSDQIEQFINKCGALIIDLKESQIR